MRRKTITVINEKGKKEKYDLIFKIESGEKSYVGYTDGSIDEDGVRLFVAIFDEKHLTPIETEEEWEMISSIVNKMKG